MKNITPTKKRLLKTFSLAAVVFLTVSGGPYGLEPLTQYAGRDLSLLLLILVPLFCDLPAILMVLELNSMMPVNGGYYRWVNRALGKRWAFFEGWWTWLYSFTDLAIYPVLFVTYISYFSPSPDSFIQTWKIPICLAMIWGSAGLNILGIVPVGRISIMLSAIVIVPFLLLFGTSFFHSSLHFSMPFQNLHAVGFSALGMALYTVMWNFLGWDNTTTYAGEVDKPIRSYIISSFVASGAVMFLYLITTYIAQSSGIDFANLNDKGYPLLGNLVGGPWLASLISIGGMASALGIFSAVTLSISRIPKAMAEDKLLPTWFAKEHKKYNTPYVSIIVSATVVSFMSLWKFTDLIIIDVILYGAGLALEFISLIVLRVKEPDAERPFKVPLNTFLLSILMLLPIAVYVLAMSGVLWKPDDNHNQVYFALGALLTAPAIWMIVKRRK